MLLYIVVYSILSILTLSVLFSKKYKKLFSFIVCFILILFESLRWKTGTDWNPYFELFENPQFHFNEPFYYLLNYFVKYFLGFYNFVLLIISGFSILSIFYILSFYKLNPIFGLLVFLSLMIGYWGMNRQIFALICALFVYKNIIEKNDIISLIWFIVGVLFHNSIFFMFFILFYNLKLYIKVIAIVCLGLIFSFFEVNTILSFLGNGDFLLDKHLLYSDFEFAGSLFLTTMRRIPVALLIGFFIIYNWYKKISTDKGFVFWAYLYFLGFILTLLVYKTMPIFVSRFSLYFMISEVFLIPSIYIMIKSRAIKLLYVMFFILFYGYVYVNNISYQKDLFCPYISIFSNLDRIMY